MTDNNIDKILGRVAIVHAWSNFDTVPSLCNTAILLAKENHLVEIFTHSSNRFKLPNFDDANISVNILQHDEFNDEPEVNKGTDILDKNRYIKSIVFSKPVKQPASILLKAWRAPRALLKLGSSRISLLLLQLNIWWKHRRKPFVCFIGVDPEGLVRANSMMRFVKAPIVYYSLELLLSQEIDNPARMDLKKREISVSRKAAFIIIQDEDRARLLCEDNKIALDNCVYVPNAPLGGSRNVSSSYWHEMFHLPKTTKVVLHAGSTSQWTGIDEIVSSVTNWPGDWVLVVHSRADIRGSTDIDRLEGLADSKRVFFSLRPVSGREYDTLINAADISIAFYIPDPGSTYTQLNLKTIGLSSGKVSYSLQAGLPVIVNDKTTIGAFVERKRCGVTVKTCEQIGDAIRKIDKNYDEYSKNAYYVFDECLNYERNFTKVIERLMNQK